MTTGELLSDYPLSNTQPSPLNFSTDLVAVLQEFQKRKAAKSSSRASTLQNKAKAAISQARKNADLAVREGIANIEQFKANLDELKLQETSQDKNIRDLTQLWQAHDTLTRTTLSLYQPFFEDLSCRRAEEVNAASATSTSFPTFACLLIRFQRLVFWS
ncbi:hypothetical protein JAAARDRAFT_173720 [Jaapia argillacea MUCL 33604]|uniref:Uncharacterized protein n=1 Tax=Jaapia argillacea MUCL 33604 TaxID=933084 RepID=A0A067QEV1_9AGAM|nr:hypothetical protein JAAARDRAFT_173720 [Jaapia argillacea MUCL 33604]